MKAGEKDLVAALPHDEGAHSTEEGLAQVQHNLEQMVERQRLGDVLAVADALVGESAS